MTSRLDSALRDALAELADTPPPPGLAAAAIRIARRHRQLRATVTGLAATAAVLLAAPVAVSSVNSGSPTMEPLVITAYSSVLGRESLLLDRDTGEYVELPYRSVVPSPDGRYALVYDDHTGVAETSRAGVLDTGTGEVRWIDGYHSSYGESVGGWSADGQQLLLTDAGPTPGPGGPWIVDPETLAVIIPYSYELFADLFGDPPLNALGNRYVWAPDGGEFALTLSIGTVEREQDSVTGIRFYELDGNPTRTVPATAPLTSEAGFSPDGTRMALQHYFFGEPIQIVDATTGQVHRTLNLPSVRFVGWADDEHLMVQERGQSLQVVTLAGEVVREVALRGWPAQLHVGSSDGLTPDAAGLTFGAR